MTATTQEPEFRLTIAQKRHLEVSLGRLLLEMDEAVRWFAERPVPGVPPSDLAAALEALQFRTREAARVLGLSPADLRADPRKKLQAWSSSWWTVALDCRSNSLRGYGELDPGAAAAVDPVMEGLADAFLALGLIGNMPGDQEPPGAGQALPSPSSS